MLEPSDPVTTRFLVAGLLVVTFPLSVIVAASLIVLLALSINEPLLLTVILDVPPKALATAVLRVPALTIVAPLKVLAPERVCVPLPVLVNPPVPEIIPTKFAVLLFAPTVNVPLPRVTKLPATPERPSIVSALLLRSSLPVLLIVTVELFTI